MISREECARDLRVYVQGGRREDLGAAQNLLFRFAMGQEDPADRIAAMDNLMADLTESRTPEMSVQQQAFEEALVAMIEQTKVVLGLQVRPVR